jgi:hypothetical protein
MRISIKAFFLNVNIKIYKFINFEILIFKNHDFFDIIQRKQKDAGLDLIIDFMKRPENDQRPNHPADHC